MTNLLKSITSTVIFKINYTEMTNICMPTYIGEPPRANITLAYRGKDHILCVFGRREH